MDIFTTSLIQSALANAMYTAAFLAGVVVMGSGILCIAFSSVSDKARNLGMPLMMIGAGMVGPGAIQIFTKLIDLPPSEIPALLPVMSNLLFPVVACGSGVYSLYFNTRASRHSGAAHS